MVNDVRPSAHKRKRKKKTVMRRPIQPMFKEEKQTAKTKEAEFQPPEAIKEEADSRSSEPKGKPKFAKKTGKKSGGKKPFPPIAWLMRKWDSLSKKGKIITLVIAALILVGGATAAAYLLKPEPPQEAPVIVVEPEPEPVEPEPTTEPSNLTGLEVGFDVNKRPVIGVMIENSPDARPQSGLSSAGIVYEAVAEGGITRFLALYQDEQPTYVGPVRSARPYYVSWVAPYDAGYAHAGGSNEGLSLIRSLGVRDLDQFANPGSYERVSSRYAPHNLYTGIDKLVSLAKSKGYKTSEYTGFDRKDDDKAETPSARSIDIDISSSLYDIKYAYDTTNNAYLRLMAGQPHIDEKTKKQINPKVVVTLVTNKGIASNNIHTTYRTTGSGKAFVFQDGRVHKATWSKKSDKSPLILKNSKGKSLNLNAGQTWITVVGNSSAVTYSP